VLVTVTPAWELEVEELEEDVGVVLVEVEVGTVEVDEGVVEVEVDVDEVVGAILDEVVVDELLGSSGTAELEGVGEGAAVVGAGAEVVGAAAEVAVYQHLAPKGRQQRTRSSSARGRRLGSRCYCRRCYLWGLGVGNGPSSWLFWGCHCLECW
jgi:hypothetical protein